MESYYEINVARVVNGKGIHYFATAPRSKLAEVYTGELNCISLIRSFSGTDADVRASILVEGLNEVMRKVGF